MTIVAAYGVFNKEAMKHGIISACTNWKLKSESLADLEICQMEVLDWEKYNVQNWEIND